MQLAYRKIFELGPVECKYSIPGFEKCQYILPRTPVDHLPEIGEVIYGGVTLDEKQGRSYYCFQIC
jgi:hypothetical protein